MSCPRVFISSTYYDLKHVREIIRDFVKDLGYDPVLSEFSDIFYNPSDNVQNSCLSEISTCDLFVLIIGKRYGSPFPGGKLSITHREYIEAYNLGIPIYSFIDLDVLHDYEFYLKNPTISSGCFRVVENNGVFDVVQQIQEATTNNLLISYTSISNLLVHLKKQWANLLSNYLKLEKLEREQDKPKNKIEDHPNLANFNEFLEGLGLPAVTQDNINNTSSLGELISALGGATEDLGTDLKIKVNHTEINVGKIVVSIIEKDMSNIKSN